jgi:hypothetical protein
MCLGFALYSLIWHSPCLTEHPRTEVKQKLVVLYEVGSNEQSLLAGIAKP